MAISAPTASTAAAPLAGKLAIITGSSRGIGEAIAHNLAGKGANVIINYPNQAQAAEAATVCEALVKTYAVKAVSVEADISTPAGAASLVAGARKAFGGAPFQVDILVNNAGVAINNKLPDIKVSDFEDSFRVNVLGSLLVTQAVQPFLPTDGSGRVVSLSSISASCGFVGQSIYGGTKAAIESMTRTWARELNGRATVNCINPGPVEGPMYKSNTEEFKRAIRGWIEHTPLMQVRPGIDPPELVEDAKSTGGRPAYKREIAGVVGMLCTPDASYITGQVVCANGGMLMAGAC
ncbi:NAD(P)-binding protein [Pleurostoma richardsiae]|jgi:NAD(P)-dependent dehydrogenase (short-subunit alcohol dehydrogenase family)|uniref:NAD(P)-binding protein n=1 Tax=Pleurostoma richardsiae TaxID=41990 RepID=A0AA38VLD8_9PEZI|nr:NAD(P)-binding protein [Pleurostoma richardsiae]